MTHLRKYLRAATIGVLLGVVFSILALMVEVVLQETPTLPAPAVEPVEDGCTTSISFRIEEDGTVTSWCGEEVNK
jgi:hypothetical protein